MSLVARTWLCATAFCAAGIVSALGHGNATGIVGDRMMAMMMLSEQIKLLTPMFERSGALDEQAIRSAAAMIEMHGGQAMTSLFPEGSLDPPSEARPEIWERWEEFEKLANKIQTLGRELALSASAAEPDTTNSEPPPELSEWERLDVSVLLGIKPESDSPQAQLTEIIATDEVTASTSSSTRSAGEIFRDLTATCSNCHATFRS